MINWQESFKIFKLKAVTEVTTRPSTSEHIIREDQASVIIGFHLKERLQKCQKFWRGKQYQFVTSFLFFHYDFPFLFYLFPCMKFFWKIGKRVCMNFVFSAKFKLGSINRKINSIHKEYWPSYQLQYHDQNLLHTQCLLQCSLPPASSTINTSRKIINWTEYKIANYIHRHINLEHITIKLNMILQNY